jgi:hypothetical protein
MEDATEGYVHSQEKPVGHVGVARQSLWFLLHLAAVYSIVKIWTPWRAGWTRGILLPLLQHPTPSGRFESLYSHLFGFSFIPASLAESVNARFRHKAAQCVWLVPAAILAYKFATFAAPSVFAESIFCGIPSILRWRIHDSGISGLARFSGNRWFRLRYDARSGPARVHRPVLCWRRL